jgi:hypothetical protein
MRLLKHPRCRPRATMMEMRRRCHWCAITGHRAVVLDLTQSTAGHTVSHCPCGQHIHIGGKP